MKYTIDSLHLHKTTLEAYYKKEIIVEPVFLENSDQFSLDGETVNYYGDLTIGTNVKSAKLSTPNNPDYLTIDKGTKTSICFSSIQLVDENDNHIDSGLSFHGFRLTLGTKSPSIQSFNKEDF